MEAVDAREQIVLALFAGPRRIRPRILLDVALVPEDAEQRRGVGLAGVRLQRPQLVGPEGGDVNGRGDGVVLDAELQGRKPGAGIQYCFYPGTHRLQAGE